MSNIPTRFTALVVLLGFPCSALGQEPPSEETVQFFQQNCFSCHTIGGGPRTGPDLEGVEDRADRDWLIEFMGDPQGVLDRGDTYGQQILAEAKGYVMPKVPGLNAAQAARILDLIAFESSLESSRFAGLQLSDRPLTEADARLGRDLFLGVEAFDEGIPACVSCHDIRGIGGFGGGSLGPDLTDVFGKLEGRQGLGAWLGAPSSPVMQPLFANSRMSADEILALVAFLQDRGEEGEAGGSSTKLHFLLSGVGLAAALLVLLDLLWHRRFRAMRRPLVQRS